MNYQGPESFRGLIEHEYNRIRDVFTRQDTPHIIVGGIGKIYNNGQKVVTEGDTETNSEIDNRFRELLKPNQSPKQMEISLLIQKLPKNLITNTMQESLVIMICKQMLYYLITLLR